MFRIATVHRPWRPRWNLYVNSASDFPLPTFAAPCQASTTLGHPESGRLRFGVTLLDAAVNAFLHRLLVCSLRRRQPAAGQTEPVHVAVLVPTKGCARSTFRARAPALT